MTDEFLSGANWVEYQGLFFKSNPIYDHDPLLGKMFIRTDQKATRICSIWVLQIISLG